MDTTPKKTQAQTQGRINLVPDESQPDLFIHMSLVPIRRWWAQSCVVRWSQGSSHTAHSDQRRRQQGQDILCLQQAGRTAVPVFHGKRKGYIHLPRPQSEINAIKLALVTCVLVLVWWSWHLLLLLFLFLVYIPSFFRPSSPTLISPSSISLVRSPLPHLRPCSPPLVSLPTSHNISLSFSSVVSFLLFLFLCVSVFPSFLLSCFFSSLSLFLRRRFPLNVCNVSSMS